MLSLIKSIYFRLASPLYRRILCEVDTLFADAKAEQSKLSDSLKSLQAEYEGLKRHVDEQDNYIRRLQEADLHGLLAQHISSEMRPPMAVVDALADVFAGMEPSTASLKHKIPADELVVWVRSLQSRCSLSKVDGTRREQHLDQDHAAKMVTLCERQLEFNTRMYRDREAAATLELARLNAELALEKYANGRAVSTK